MIDAAVVTSARDVSPDGLPAYREVRATARPAILIEVGLPMEGCGVPGCADAGRGWVNAMRLGLERGYATAKSTAGTTRLA